MNFSLRSLSVSSLSNSPLISKRAITVTSSSFSRHFSNVFYNVRSLHCKSVSFSNTLNSAVKVDNGNIDTMLYQESTYDRRKDLFQSKCIQEFILCTFNNCRAPMYTNGGAICLETDNFWGDLFISKCTFNRCKASLGGAIYANNYYFVSTMNCVVDCNADTDAHYIFSTIKNYDYKSYVNYTTVYGCGCNFDAPSVASIKKCKPCISRCNFTKNEVTTSANNAVVYILCTAQSSNIDHTYWERNTLGNQLMFIGKGDETVHEAKNAIFNNNDCNDVNCACFIPKDVQYKFSESYFIGTKGKLFPEKTPVEEKYDSQVFIDNSFLDIAMDNSLYYVKVANSKNDANEKNIKKYEILSTGLCLSQYVGLTQRDIYIISIAIPVLLSLVIIFTVLGLTLKPRWICCCCYDKNDPTPYCCCTEDCFLCCCCHDDECCRCCYHEDICYCLSNPCWCDWEAYKRTTTLNIRINNGTSKPITKKVMVEVLTEEEAIKQEIVPPVTTSIDLPCTTVKSTMR